eukprot:g11711.t1
MSVYLKAISSGLRENYRPDIKKCQAWSGRSTFQLVFISKSHLRKLTAEESMPPRSTWVRPHTDFKLGDPCPSEDCDGTLLRFNLPQLLHCPQCGYNTTLPLPGCPPKGWVFEEDDS